MLDRFFSLRVFCGKEKKSFSETYNFQPFYRKNGNYLFSSLLNLYKQEAKRNCLSSQSEFLMDCLLLNSFRA